MKVQLLKNLIKEAVREVLKEELEEVLQSYKPFTPISETSTNSSNFLTFNKSTNVRDDSHYLSLEDILNETRQSMTRSDYSNIIGESTVTSSTTKLDTPNDSYNVGLDLSNLDFVKKAAAVYNLSKEKDRK